MLKNRLIPVLLLKNGQLVRSEKFSFHQVIGDPFHEVKRFNEWLVDELIYIDITREGKPEKARRDVRSPAITDPMAVLRAVSETCFLPLTWGGGIRSLDEMETRFKNGADKVIFNSEALKNPSLVKEASAAFGSQAIVVGVDFVKTEGSYRVATDFGRNVTELDPVEWTLTMEELGAGEIFLQSVDRDGVGIGYDTDMIEEVTRNLTIPVICCGGVGQFEHFADGIAAGGAAVAAANLWHFKEQADRQGKTALMNADVPVRAY